MTYSIIGTGNVGAALARQFSRNGIAVRFANTRAPQFIEALATKLGETIRTTSISARSIGSSRKPCPAQVQRQFGISISRG